MADRSNITSWLTDMDGVLVHEGHPIPGAAELIAKWTAAGTPFLVLTNNSIYTPRDLSARLKLAGLDIPEERIWTSALATASFLNSQKPGGSAFVIGEAGMTQALHDVGYVQTDQNPDYVVLGETRNLSFENLTKAVRLIGAGERFIVTIDHSENPIIEVLALRIVFGIGLQEAHTMHKIGYVGDRSWMFEMEYGRALATADKLNAEFASRAESAPPFRVREAIDR